VTRHAPAAQAAVQASTQLVRAGGRADSPRALPRVSSDRGEQVLDAREGVVRHASGMRPLGAGRDPFGAALSEHGGCSGGDIHWVEQPLDTVPATHVGGSGRHVRTRGGSGGRRLTCPPRSSGVRDKDAPVRSPMSRCRTGAHRRDRALHGAHQVGDMPRSVPAPWPPGGARLPRRREGAGGRGRGAWRLYESGAPRERSTTATMTRSSARYDCIPHQT